MAISNYSYKMTFKQITTLLPSGNKDNEYSQMISKHSLAPLEWDRFSVKCKNTSYGKGILSNVTSA